MHARWQRLAALIRKESIQLIRDRRSLLLFVGLPLIELFLFAYAVSLTVDHLPTALVDQSRDARSREFVLALENSGYFDMALELDSEVEARRAIDAGTVKAGVVIPPDFAASLERGDATALILLDGSDSFSVQSGYSAANTVARQFAVALAAEALQRSGAGQAAGPSRLPVTTIVRVLYNPDMGDMVFILPGLVALITQVVIVAQSSVSVVRERELGTFEQLLATPARPIELLIAKLLPAVLVVTFDLALILGLGVYWFGVPFQGSLPLFAWLGLLFIVSCTGLGLLVSTVARTQRQAQQLTAVFMMVTMLLTGFLYPRAAMPRWTQIVGNLIPLTYFVRIARGIITKGIGIELLWTDAVALALYAALSLALAAVTFKTRLD